jgi:hypothetical protein
MYFIGPKVCKTTAERWLSLPYFWVKPQTLLVKAFCLSYHNNLVFTSFLELYFLKWLIHNYQWTDD